ncbi:hypothetical protein STCU_11415 [Strigomonas culicis]|uniref:Uncharacterized protein n=1 Tax=Strigomonas culicis TaxID=28005 RepID=S9TE40_9TRYP|nr:hypothetical protein STCU_11415 [Strigomonas culicis]|eukprot:EPY16317.1 hypothetical protein STCU_11415 [Strigomonas culicis]
MHDRKKKKHAPLTPEEQQRRDAEHQYIGGLYTKLIQENKYYTTSRTALGAMCMDSDASTDKWMENRRASLQETECLLLRVPEAYSMYNYRRNIILDEIHALTATAAVDTPEGTVRRRAAASRTGATPLWRS